MSSSSSSSSSSANGSSCATPAEMTQGMSSVGLGSGSGPTSASGKRFEFLLKQTELFSHFMGDNKKLKSPLKVRNVVRDIAVLALVKLSER